MAAAKSAAGTGQLSPNNVSNNQNSSVDMEPHLMEEGNSNKSNLFSTLVDTIKAGKNDEQNYGKELEEDEIYPNDVDHHEPQVFRGNFHG